MESKKNVKKISKDEIMKAVSDASCVSISMVQIILQTLDYVVQDALKDVNFDKDVSIRLFDGVYIDGTYVPERTKKNNLTGKIIDIASKIKVKARITKGYLDKINR